MAVNICRIYHSLPDVRTLSAGEIRFFYEAIKGELMDATRPRRPAPKL